MAYKVAFFTRLPPQIVEVIVGLAPEGFQVEVVSGQDPEERQIAAVEDADFILNFGG